MQNWAHVAAVLGALNRLPRAQRDVDIMRVRPFYLAGQARLYRQTILLGSYASAEANALFARAAASHAGKARVAPAALPGVLCWAAPGARALFERLPRAPGGPAGAADARFALFAAAGWPRLREAALAQGGQVLYVPSYFDYVRVRNLLATEGFTFAPLCEYTERAAAARGRALFADGRRRLLVYTERAQFFNRHRLRGAKGVTFYQLPEHPAFYAEVVNFLEGEDGTGGPGGAAAAVGDPPVRVYFSRFDALRLARVAGSARAARMLAPRRAGGGAGGAAAALAGGGAGAGGAETFLFCS
jgi:U3 small nucleolar RNA-associated protein 25